MVIGAVLIPGAKAPKLVTNELVSQMKPGSVLVDIAVDQGGCFEDTRPTTHDDPTFAGARLDLLLRGEHARGGAATSTYALTNATLPYTVALANKGWQQACRDDHSLALGLNTHAGKLTNAPVGEALASRRSRWTMPLPDLAQAVRTYLDHLTVERGLAPNTLTSYRRDLRRYRAHLAETGIEDLDAVTRAW